MSQPPDRSEPAAAAAAMVIKAKLRVPSLGDRFVRRPRLDDLIAELVSNGPLVSVYAAAGAGKTTAVVQALPRIGLPVAWLTVDGTDAAPERLLAYLQAALGAHAPDARGVACDALQQGVTCPEATGLLLEAVGPSPVLLALDGVERIAASGEALAVLSALVRYAPPMFRVILVGRRDLPLDLDTRTALRDAVSLRADELAFTVDETAEVLASEGSTDLVPETVMELTGGWVAGVLFEARRSAHRVLGLESEPHGLHAFLASQVIEQLDPAQREFLVNTSLLPEVTAAEATALGQKGAAGLLAELRSIHLPVTWDDGGKRMRCHPRFREFLLTLLERRDDVGVVSTAGDSTLAGDATAHIRLVEFGQPVIEVNGVVVRPRIKKSYELLAYLASRPTPQVERDELLHVLFGGRADESTRSYLRQATHRLREVLPDAAILAFEGSRLGLHGDFRLVSDSGLVTELLAGAAQKGGDERLARLLEALSLIDGGEYLAGARSVWVDERREELRRLADDVRHETAELLLSKGDTEGAKRLALIVVRSDPYREATWRLLMNLASMSGDEAGVVNAYRMCERAMGEVGIAVSEKTESLLASLRR